MLRLHREEPGLYTYEGVRYSWRVYRRAIDSRQWDVDRTDHTTGRNEVVPTRFDTLAQARKYIDTIEGRSNR